ncbi:hypothetical protein B0H14DRAFT_1064923 [Mycena olivaceomarginata]|nr:hypothetical protein B0H14DRAFT_1064923 [Mycena olivaceomarginata]
MHMFIFFLFSHSARQLPFNLGSIRALKPDSKGRYPSNNNDQACVPSPITIRLSDALPSWSLQPGAVPSCMRDQTWDARPFPDNCKTRVGWTLLNRSNSAEYTIGFLRKSSRVFNVLVKHPQDHLGQRVELCLILITVSPRLRSCPIS